MDTLLIILAIASVIIATAAVILSVIFYRANKKTQKVLKYYDWNRVQTGSAEFGKQIKREFIPDVIFSISPRSGIIALMMRDAIDESIPLIIGMVFYKGTVLKPKVPDSHYYLAETSKLRTYIPRTIEAYGENAKILIVAEYSLTGNMIDSLKKKLVDIGFGEENIKAASLIQTSVAKGEKPLDFDYFSVRDPEFYMPWGRAS